MWVHGIRGAKATGQKPGIKLAAVKKPSANVAPQRVRSGGKHASADRSCSVSAQRDESSVISPRVSGAVRHGSGQGSDQKSGIGRHGNGSGGLVSKRGFGVFLVFSIQKLDITRLGTTPSANRERYRFRMVREPLKSRG